MKIRDIMVKDVVCVESGDFVSAAIAKMKARKINQLVVKDGGAYSGLIELKNIVTKDIDPSKTKVATLARNANSIKADDDIEDAAKSIISQSLRALPVMDGGRLSGIVSETDIVKIADEFIDTNSTIDEIKSKFVYAKKDDNIGKIKHMMINENVSRIPIVEDGKVLGVVSTLDMIKAIEAKTGFDARDKTKNRGFRGKMRVEETCAGTIMSNAITVKKSEKIKNVIKLLQKNEQVIIEDGGVSIITPKDIIELFLSKPTKQVYVQITGMQEEDQEFQAEIDVMTTKFVQKMGKSFRDVQGLFVHVEKSSKQGVKSRYSIRTRFITEDGIFISRAGGWNRMEAVQDAFKNLEKEARNHLERKHENATTGYKKQRSI